MVVIPSIDILKGECVRLYQGDYARVTGYGISPEQVAAQFQDAGATRLHVVDLDAAHGDGNNRERIRNIRRDFSGVIEVGGGVRTPEDVEELLGSGVDRLIVGTVFARTPEIVAGWISTYGRVFIAGIDARDGMVKVSGWEGDSGMSSLELAATAGDMGMASIIYTNIMADGTLSGPDIEGSDEVGKASRLPVIVSGGVGGVKDLQRIRSFGSDFIVGAITGKAVYEGFLNIREALARFSEDAVDPGAQSW
jgi:phosphoribosylformimino-5-aminoimidazole carboxamide ribotide isomerase